MLPRLCILFVVPDKLEFFHDSNDNVIKSEELVLETFGFAGFHLI